MILNLTGPPGVGKSSLVNEILLDNKKTLITYLDIANYKKSSGNLNKAWNDLVADAVANRHYNIIIESCGTDWRLEWLNSVHQPICTIFLYGNINEIERRIRNRAKDPDLADLEVQEAIYTIGYIYNQKLWVNFAINTHDKTTKKVYEIVKEKIKVFKTQKEIS